VQQGQSGVRPATLCDELSFLTAFQDMIWPYFTYEGKIMAAPDNITVVYLRRLSEQMGAIREDNREIKSRLGILEQQRASLSTRLDRIELRLDRIQRRMELVEA